jgi:hypothetical protein
MQKKKLPFEVLEYFRRQGSIGGKLGGNRSLQTMTRAERVARAKKASAATVVARAKKKQAALAAEPPVSSS